MSFLQARRLWFHLIVESASYGRGWISGFSRFPGWGNLCLCSCGWSWISSPWSAVTCPIVTFGCIWVWYGFGHPIFYCSGLCSCFARELPCHVLTRTCWLMLGAWFQCCKDFWVSSYLFVFPGIRSSPKFLSSEVESHASGFWSSSYSNLKTSSSIRHRR